MAITGEQVVRVVAPSNRLIQLGSNASLGVFFPIGNNWNLGVQAQGYYTRLNYVIVDGGSQNVTNSFYEFSRMHGGFTAGLGLRKSFIQKRLIPKAPTSARLATLCRN